jgi:ketosteroid isomerase-like protein
MRVEEAARLTQEFLAAMNRRDREAWIAVFDPDFEGYSGLVAVESGEPFRGLEGAAAWFDNLMEVYDRVHGSLEQTLVVGELALQLVRTEYVGKGSGIALAPLVALVSKIHDDRYVYVHSHFDLAEGFLDMGRRLDPAASSPASG